MRATAFPVGPVARSRGDAFVEVVGFRLLVDVGVAEAFDLVRLEIGRVGLVLEVGRHSEIVVADLEAIPLDLTRIQVGVRHQLRFRIRFTVDGQLTENIHRMSAGTIALELRALDFLVVWLVHGARKVGRGPRLDKVSPPNQGDADEGAQGAPR